MPEFVEEDAGYIVPYLNLNEMSEKIVGLARDKATRTRLGERAAGKVHDLYDVSIGAMRIKEIIDRELDSQTGFPPATNNGEQR
jgi:glycosyltransferase involved in cell wall biosynthesis